MPIKASAVAWGSACCPNCPAGLSPTQAPADAILKVDLLGVAHVLDSFAGVLAPGGSGVVIASMAGSFAAGKFPAELETALALTPTDQLLSLPFWSDPSFSDAGTAYSVAKRSDQLRVQAASLAWGARGARINSISPGVISTSMGQQELDGESGHGMRAMVNASAPAGTAPRRTSPRPRHSGWAPNPPSSPEPMCWSTAELSPRCGQARSRWGDFRLAESGLAGALGAGHPPEVPARNRPVRLNWRARSPSASIAATAASAMTQKRSVSRPAWFAAWAANRNA